MNKGYSSNAITTMSAWTLPFEIRCLECVHNLYNIDIKVSPVSLPFAHTGLAAHVHDIKSAGSLWDCNLSWKQLTIVTIINHQCSHIVTIITHHHQYYHHSWLLKRVLLQCFMTWPSDVFPRADAGTHKVSWWPRRPNRPFGRSCNLHELLCSYVIFPLRNHLMYINQYHGHYHSINHHTHHHSDANYCYITAAPLRPQS